MKRFIAITLSFAMCAAAFFCMTGCSGSDKKPADETEETEEVTESVDETEDDGVPSDTQGGDGTFVLPDDIDTDTLSGKLAAAFIEEVNAGKSVEEIADALARETESTGGYSCVTNPMESGYFPGFDVDITGFTKACGFGPLIGTIPFTAYIFEVDNPEEFSTFLSDNANPAWNICTEADETLCVTAGNIVFFVMCPSL